MRPKEKGDQLLSKGGKDTERKTHRLLLRGSLFPQQVRVPAGDCDEPKEGAKIRTLIFSEE